jgi:membrane fusion protein, copper/silver efflux system
VDFDNTGGVIMPNSSVRTVGVVVGKRNNVLAVPVDAVGQDGSGKPVVKVLDNGNWKVVVVETGLSDGYFVEITKGLEEDQTVQVVPGQGKWLLGTPVSQ